jgi:hypothetical protein
VHREVVRTASQAGLRGTAGAASGGAVSGRLRRPVCGGDAGRGGGGGETCANAAAEAGQRLRRRPREAGSRAVAAMCGGGGSVRVELKRPSRGLDHGRRRRVQGERMGRGGARGAREGAVAGERGGRGGLPGLRGEPPPSGSLSFGNHPKRWACGRERSESYTRKGKN